MSNRKRTKRSVITGFDPGKLRRFRRVQQQLLTAQRKADQREGLPDDPRGINIEAVRESMRTIETNGRNPNIEERR